MTSPSPLHLLLPGHHAAAQTLLNLAQSRPFRRAEARKVIGSTNYADRALQELLDQNLLRRVSINHTTLYQLATETHQGATEDALNAAKHLIYSLDGPITGLQLGAYWDAADVLHSRGEVMRVTVGFCQIYSRCPKVTTAHLTDHQDCRHTEGLSAQTFSPVGLTSSPAVRVGGLKDHQDCEHSESMTATLRPATVDLSGPVMLTETLGDKQRALIQGPTDHSDVMLPATTNIEVGDYLWVKTDGNTPVQEIVTLPREDVTRAYLTSIPGVTAQDAEDLMSLLGESCLIRLRSPALLMEVIAAPLHAPLAEEAERPLWEAYEIGGLVLLDLTRRQAAPLAKTSGAAGRHHHNPYLLAPTLGFNVVDALAKKRGFLPDNTYRHVAVCAELVRRHTLLGHTFLPLEELHAQLAEASLLDEEVTVATTMAHEQNAIVVDQGNAYLPNNLADERELASRLRDHLAVRPRTITSPDLPSLNTEQKQAVWNALTFPLSLLTGSAGSGKSTTLSSLCDAAESQGLTVALAAPTGKAALRLSQATGRNASTIHRLIGASRTAAATKNVDAQLVILDEASMVGDKLLLNLIRMLKNTTRLVLVGDPNQLPPIEVGSPLRSLLGRVPTTRLSHVYRHRKDSRVMELASVFLQGDDLTWEEEVEAAQDATEIASRAQGLQLLTPTRAGPFGAATLNEAVQARKGLKGGTEIKDGVAHVGDPVLQTTNDYAREIFNGHIGQVLEISRAKTVVAFDGREVTYSGLERLSLQPAYAITIHRAQGSEWEDVGVVLHESQLTMLNRTLAYTAITRAKKNVTLFGSPLAWEVAASRRLPTRQTSLIDRLNA